MSHCAKSFWPCNRGLSDECRRSTFGTTHPITLKVGIFATDEKLTILDMKMYEDNIYNLLSIAEEYVLKNLRWRTEITGIDRKEISEIPVAVIRGIGK